jgi:hypothetical protein
MRLRTKNKTLPSKKNPRLEMLIGDDKWKDKGRWVKKTRIIDRDRKRYRETVVDPETGEVIHHCDEPLPEHKGHGSDKRGRSRP